MPPLAARQKWLQQPYHQLLAPLLASTALGVSSHDVAADDDGDPSFFSIVLFLKFCWLVVGGWWLFNTGTLTGDGIFIPISSYR
jgi:hypothetical protein